MNSSYQQYTQELIRPRWAPPGWLFGPVWTFLYILIAISFGKVFWMLYQTEISFVIALPFVINLISNFSYTPIQFSLKNNTLASIDIFIVLGAIIWSMIVIYPYAPWVTYMQIPYLLWVSFATVLQLTITYLNRKKR